MNKQSLGIDIDGVLADLIPVWLGLYNRDYDDSLTAWDIHHWDVHEYVKPECGKKIYEYLEFPYIYDMVVPTENCRDSLKVLRNYFSITFITHSTKGCSGRKLQWLKENKLCDNGDDYIEAENKTTFGLKLLVDDYIKNIAEFNSEHSRGLLFTQPWNIRSLYSLRAFGWDDATKMLMNIGSSKIN